jgi:hypothetical protein
VTLFELAELLSCIPEVGVPGPFRRQERGADTDQFLAERSCHLVAVEPHQLTDGRVATQREGAVLAGLVVRRVGLAGHDRLLREGEPVEGGGRSSKHPKPVDVGVRASKAVGGGADHPG